MKIGLMLVTLAVPWAVFAQTPDGESRRFRVEVPAEVAARPTHLLLRDVSVPRNRGVVLRAYVVGDDSAKVYLGSTAIPAISRSAQGATALRLLRINVTTAFRRWFARARSPHTVEIVITPRTGGTTPDLLWSVRAVELVHPN
jgi:hypothetical protein